MDLKLKGRTVLIAGASRNMGRLASLAFAREGANLSLCTSTKMKDLGQVADEARALGVQVLTEQCDITKPAAVDAWVANTRERFGGVDVAMSLAGYRLEGKTLEISAEDWQRTIDVNLTGPFNICRSVLPVMKERGWGRILNVSGIAPFTAGDTAKAMVKMGIVGLTRGIAREFGPYNITANCVGPGGVARGAEHGAPAAKRASPCIPHAGKPEDVADLMVYLASEQAGFITGQCYLINGGAAFL